jgi:hypothetical protein
MKENLNSKQYAIDNGWEVLDKRYFRKNEDGNHHEVWYTGSHWLRQTTDENGQRRRNFYNTLQDALEKSNSVGEYLN